MEANKQLHEKDTEEENPDDVLKALLCDKKLYSELYPYQRDGILFLYNAYKNGKNRAEGSRNGVILADEMGLGKSIQVIVFLHFMIMNTHKLKNALLVMPAGLLSDWKGKLENWTPDMNVFIYQNSEKELPKKLRQLQKTGGILLVSYSTFINHYETLTTYKGKPFNWDCLVFDEAHRLKNSASKRHKVAASISAGFHILMTGTPIQNNLKEYWSLFSLISDTCLLGTYKTFKTNFENPITKGMEADAGPDERALGMILQEELEKITEPFFLRRRKDQIEDPSDHTPSEGVLCLPKKKEYVVWIKLSPEQEAAYCNIVDESSVLTFQSIHSLTAVCTHPRLNSDIMEHEASEVHLAESGKLAFMLALLERLTANGNFVLVFSNYIKILNIIQKALTQTPWGRNAFLRIDGQNPNQRDKIVRRFQKKRSENILLLTTSVGAEGLTLTAADSVVFADISWNQSVDAQAVGRAHRIGQTKEVTTYRLITCGTLEETMYRRQLFKGSLTRQAMGDEQNPLRHFTQDELKTYLTLQQTQFSYTQQQLQKQGAKILNITEIFGEGISSLAAASVCGISDHGQLLTTSQGEDLETDMARMHITETAKMCKQKIEAESHLTRQQAGEDLSVQKCFKKGKIRRKTQNARTPGLPRKYKCFKAPFSGPRRTLHISRPWVFESSDDSSNVSADDDENVSVKTEVTSDLVDKHNTYTCNSTCSKGISEINKSTNPKDTVEVSECISKDRQRTELDPDISPVTDLNMDLPNVADKDESRTPGTDLEKDVASVAAPVNSSVYPEHISTPDNSELDSMDNTSDSDISDSQSHKSSASSTMHEHSCSTSPEDSHIEKSGSSHLPEANTSENIATDTSMPDISLMQPNETDEFTDLKEEANIKGIQKIPIVSVRNETVCTKTALNLNRDSYQDPPQIFPFTPSASPSTSPEDSHIEKCGPSHLPEANTSGSIATDTSMPDISLVQPNETDEFTDLKEEVNSPGANFKDPKIENIPVVNREQNEIKCDKTLNFAFHLNSDSYQDPPCTFPSTLSTSPCTTQKMILNQEDQELQQASKDPEVDIVEVCIKENTTISHQEIEDESHFSRQTCINVASRKPDRKAKFRRWSYETTAASQPRKYKRYTSPLSSTRRTTTHMTAHEEKISERTIQNMSVSDMEMYVSAVTDLDEDVSSVAAPVNSSVYPEHISTPDNTEYSELYSMDNTADSDTSDSHSYKSSSSGIMDEHSCPTSPEDSHIEISGSSPQNHHFCSANRNVSYVSDEDNYTNKNDKDYVQEANNISDTNRSMTNRSLVQSSEAEKLTNLEEEANSKIVKFPAGQELKIQVNDEFEERVPLLPLNLNTLFSEYPTHSTTPEPSHEFQKKELQLSVCNQVVPVLCDYSLTPSCISVCITPSAGNRRHNNELRQLGECDELSVFKDEENCHDLATTFLDLSTNSSEYCQQLNLPQIQGSESVQSSSEREENIKDHEVADYKDSFKSGLRSSQTAPILWDYSLIPGCISLVDTPSVEKGKHALSGHFHSTPLQSAQLVHQESPDHLKRRLPFSQGNSSTPVKSGLLKRNKKRTLVKTARKTTKLIFQENDSDDNFCQVRKTAMDRNEVQIISSEKQVEQCKISMNRTADKNAFNAKKYINFAVSNRKRSTRTKVNDSTVSPTTPEWKYGKENHHRLSVFSQSSPQASKRTQIQPDKRQLLTRVDTDQLRPMNRAIDLNQLESHRSRAKTLESEMFYLKTPVLKGISTSPTQLTQVITSPNTDNYPRVQDCSTADSREDNEDHELDHEFQSISEDEMFLSPMSSVPDSVTSNGQAQVVKSFTSGYKPMWDMFFSPEIQYTPRKERHVANVINQANSNPHKMEIEKFSDNESEQQLAFESYMDYSFLSEKNDDSDDSVEQASGPVATLVTYNVQSPSERKRIITGERDEAGGIQAFRDVRQFCNQTNRASEISEIQPQAQMMGGYAETSECHKAPLEEGQESMFRYLQNDSKSEKASDFSTPPVDEIFCLLHKLKRL